MGLRIIQSSLSIASIAAWLVFSTGESRADDGVNLRESAKIGRTAKTSFELDADGQYRPEAGEKKTEPLDLKVRGRLDYVERVLNIGQDETARKVVRMVERAGAAIDGKVIPTKSSLRPEVGYLVAEKRDDGVFTFSPGGPLTRSELDLTQVPADPLDLPGLLPRKKVKINDKWTVSAEAARSLSGYDALAVNALQATLVKIDDDRAIVRLKGEVRGASLGGLGKIEIEGTCEFDRKAGWIDSVKVDRVEVREAGPVEAGLDLKSSIALTRSVIEAPAELNDEILKKLAVEATAERSLLLANAPDGSFSFVHDRDWHVFSENVKRIVLRRVERGEVTAQCNLMVGPKAGRGRHQDPKQFREDIREALGKRFGRFADEGEIDQGPNGNYCYRVVAQGKAGDLEVVWIYDLIAGPEGDQLSATFTLAATETKGFGDQDIKMVGSIQWIARDKADAKPAR